MITGRQELGGGNLLVILDSDETYTEAPEIWDAFIKSLLENGHVVVCCTMRVAGNGINDDVIRDMTEKHGIPIVYAATYKDKWEAIQNYGYHPENAIWIDDRPMYIFMHRGIDQYPD